MRHALTSFALSALLENCKPHLRLLLVAVAGATALVFSCRWRSRFGPHGLLAAKVLRDPFEAEEDLKSFEYEARLLKDIR